MFIIYPDPYSSPCFRIGPFTTRDISYNSKLPESNAIDHYFTERFGEKSFIYTENGRKAINIALAYYKLSRNDVVTIFTTSNNFYISSCVTNEIEKYCLWSRKIESNTKVILVNHEFGYPYANIEEIKKYKLPIIEDCAASFFSQDEANSVGSVGDFVIYSFPKMFPLQIGGLLVNNIDAKLPESNLLSKAENRYIKNVLSHYIQTKDEIIKKYLRNHAYLSRKFKKLGFNERFKLKSGDIPSVFMFRVDDDAIDLPELKKHFYAHGIHCSVFYGERAFYIPCHHNLEESDLDYFSDVMEAFLNK